MTPICLLRGSLHISPVFTVKEHIMQAMENLIRNDCWMNTYSTQNHALYNGRKSWEWLGRSTGWSIATHSLLYLGVSTLGNACVYSFGRLYARKAIACISRVVIWNTSIRSFHRTFAVAIVRWLEALSLTAKANGWERVQIRVLAKNCYHNIYLPNTYHKWHQFACWGVACLYRQCSLSRSTPSKLRRI